MRCRAMCSHVMWCHLMWSDTMQWDGCYVFRGLEAMCLVARSCYVMRIGCVMGWIGRWFSVQSVHNGAPMSQNYDSVLRSSYKVLPCTTPYFQILQNISPHHKYDSALPVLQSTTPSYKVCERVLQSTKYYYRVLLCTTKYYIEIQSS